MPIMVAIWIPKSGTDAHAQAEPRDDERQPSRQYGAERDHQDEQRGDEPDRLGAALAAFQLLDRVAAELDLQPVAFGLLREVHQLLDRLDRQRFRSAIEPHPQHACRAVGTRRIDVGGDDMVELRDLASERTDSVRVLDREAVRCCVHDVDGAAGEAREPFLEQLHRFCRVATRDGEVDLRASTSGTR
jgi:hypothetical protein